MNYFVDTGLLFAYCFFFLFYTAPNKMYVLAFLAALILTCCANFLKSKPIFLGITLLYLLVSLLFPTMLFFYPVCAYLLFSKRLFLPLGFSCILVFWNFCIEMPNIFFFFLTCFGVLLAFLLERSTRHGFELRKMYKQTRDDSTEQNLLLTEKNRSIREKQDYEIYAATLRERNRIAREIHDNVGHLLSRSILMVGALRTINGQESLFEPLERLHDSLNSAMDSIRSSVHDLHDEAINMQESIETLLKDFRYCPADFQYDMGKTMPSNVKYCFISIIKEALSNVMKHSNASHLVIIMREHPSLYQLCIEDNGDVPASLGSGIGLSNMTDRVRALRGNIQITTTKGFKIFITIPKET